jgi:mono/diheme cytochrome c family protein
MGMLLSPVVGVAFLLIALKTGLISVDAHSGASEWEGRLALWARTFATKTEVGRLTPPKDISEEDRVDGALYYREYCSQCHGGTEEASSLSGALFHPPAPSLADLEPVGRPRIYYYAKKGIRNTGMPSFQEVLSDQALWQISLFVSEQRASRRAQRVLTEPDYVETTPVEYGTGAP